MNIKQNIETLLFTSGVTMYAIYKETGIAQTTLSRFVRKESEVENMSLKNALLLNEFYLNNKEELQMEKAIKAIENVELGWASEGVEVLGGVEVVAEGYVEVMDHEELHVSAEQFILELLKEDGRVKEDDAYEDEAAAHDDGFVWAEDVGYWMDLD